jgi:hypothetical protein
MKKVTWLCLLVVVLAGGCLKIESDEAGGVIAISGGKVDPQRAILNLMQDWRWTHESAGSQTIRSGSAKRQQESSHAWISARTAEGKLVQFGIDRDGSKRTNVAISVEEGASVTTAEVTAELARRLQGQARPARNTGPLTIRIEPLTPSGTDANACEARWTASGDWAHSPRNARFQVRDEGGGLRSYSVYVAGPAPWMPRGAEREGPVSFEVQRCAGTMTFKGERSARAGSGVVTFDPNTAYVDALTKLVSDELRRDDLLTLFFNEMDLDHAVRVNQAWGDELTLHSLMAFTSYHVKPEYIRGVRDAGYEFSPDEIIKVSSYHVPLDMLTGFKRARYDFSPNDLIKINSYHVTVDDFVSFRDAGYDFSIDQMIKAKSYHIPVETARTLHEAGFDYSLSELIKLRSYHVPPEDIVAFRDGGYALSLDEVIKARSYHLNVADAVRLKQLGYDFSLNDLIKVKSYNVPTQFIIDVYDPDYEPFTADELIAFRQKGIDAATVRKIRTAARRVPSGVDS